MVIDDPELEAMVERLAGLMGTDVEQAVKSAVAERFEHEERLRRRALAPAGKASVEELLAIGRRVAALPVVDPRSPDEIIGYDEHGLPA